ncbi:hypothetical protein APA_1993 [Pseudanabaena sp. lw0831]|nr:hypothetical protein APA_1993 [Pseudanabaena sp. lw0831]
MVIGQLSPINILKYNILPNFLSDKDLAEAEIVQIGVVCIIKSKIRRSLICVLRNISV